MRYLPILFALVGCVGDSEEPPDEWTTRCGEAPGDIPAACACVDLLDHTVEDEVFDCLFCGLYHCAPTVSGVWQNFGATWVDIAGPQGEDCAFLLFGDVEGTIDVYDCRVPMPVIPGDEWSNIDAFVLPSSLEPHCTQVETCRPGYGQPCQEGYSFCP